VRQIEEIINNQKLKIKKKMITKDGRLAAFVGDASIDGVKGSIVFSVDGGWEHVSFSPYDKRITPSWDNTCTLKKMIWSDEEECIQVHPKKSEYVNIKKNCLHIWSPEDNTKSIWKLK